MPEGPARRARAATSGPGSVRKHQRNFRLPALQPERTGSLAVTAGNRASPLGAGHAPAAPEEPAWPGRSGDLGAKLRQRSAAPARYWPPCAALPVVPDLLGSLTLRPGAGAGGSWRGVAAGRGQAEEGEGAVAVAVAARRLLPGCASLGGRRAALGSRGARSARASPSPGRRRRCCRHRAAPPPPASAPEQELPRRGAGGGGSA